MASAYTRLYTEALNVQRSEIRLLKLAAGKYDTQLRAKLEVVSLDQQPTYEALSYTWGSPATGDYTISLENSHSIPITANLFTALRRLRNRISVRTIWIDALCINQHDSVEQGQQIRMMGVIYTNAIKVLIWLGDYKGVGMYDAWNLRRPHFSTATKPHGRNSRGQKFALALDEAIASTEPKWHDRAWVVQEYIKAPAIDLCFGAMQVKYDPVSLLDLIMGSPEPLEQLRAFHFKINDMQKLKLAKDLFLLEAALFTSTQYCGKPMDKVLSVLGLINRDEADHILVDPTALTQHVFGSATYMSIKTNRNFDILNLIRFNTQETDVSRTLPSWVVDFTVPQEPSVGIHFEKYTDLRWKEHGGGDIQHTASYSKPRPPYVPQRFRLRGTTLDTIGSVLKIDLETSSDSATRVLPELTALLQDAISTFAHKGTWTSRSSISNDQSSTDLDPGELLAGDQSAYALQIWQVLKRAFAYWTLTARPFAAQQYNKNDDTSEADKSPSHILHEALSIIERHGPNGLWFLEYAVYVSNGCSFFVTRQGFIGIAPTIVSQRDYIVLVEYSRFPIILRRVGHAYKFCGFAYVHGIWQQELLPAWKRGDIVEAQFVLE